MKPGSKGQPRKHQARLEHAVPALAAMKRVYEETLGKIGQKTKLGEALLYALTRWSALTRYTMDGRLEISNNAAERAMRPLAMGRRNWTFAGSDAGGERAAIFYTLIQSAKLNGLDPEAYLSAVVAHIADHPIKRIGEFLPWNMAVEATPGSKLS